MQRLRNGRRVAKMICFILFLMMPLGCQVDELAEPAEPTAASAATQTATAPVLVGATTGPNKVTVQPTMTATATATPMVTRPATFPGEPPAGTGTPTPMHTPAPCLAADAAQFAGEPALLEIEFWRDGEPFVWEERTAGIRALGFTLPPITTGLAQLAPDRSHFIYAEAVGVTEFDIYVRDLKTGGEKVVGRLDGAPVLARNVWATGVKVWFDWLQDSRRLIIHMFPTAEGLGDPPLEELFLVDVTAGTITTILPPIEAQRYLLNDEQSELYTLSPEGLTIINLETSEVTQVALPMRDFYDPFSQLAPDGQHLLLSGNEGVLLFDLATQSYETVPVYFPSIGQGHGSVFPQSVWAPDGSTVHFLVPELFDSPIHLSNNEVYQEDAQFSYLRLELPSLTLTEVATLTGNLLTASFSPDRDHFIWLQNDKQNQGRLNIYDTRHDTYSQYAAGRQLLIKGWSPDGSIFLYLEFNQPQVIVGAPCQEALVLATERDHNSAYWLEDGRLLVQSCYVPNNCLFDLYQGASFTLRERLPIPADDNLEYVIIRTTQE